jgi:RHS repeat-associated protein
VATASDQFQIYKNFNIPTIPAGATVNGIEVSVEGYRGGTSAKSWIIAMSRNGDTFINIADGSTGDMGTSQDATIALGSSTDTWGVTWAPSDFTNANFKLKMSTYFSAASGLYLNQVKIKVYYNGGSQGSVTTTYVNKYYEKTDSVVTTNYYLGSKLIAVRKDGTLSYIMQDHLGSTSVTADSSGASTSTTRYLPFGATRSTTGTLPTDKLFTSQRLDSTGLYYYGARYYDPSISRFISPDTIVPNPANPQNLNRYSYCLNNPLRYIDPTGHADQQIGTASIGDSEASIYSCSGNGFWIDYGNNTFAWTDSISGIGISVNNQAVYIQGYSYASFHLGTPAGGVNFFVGQANAQLLSEAGHQTLNAAGFFFDLADAANAAWYAGEGDPVNAGLSGMAIIPIAGSVLKTGFRSYSSLKKFLGSVGEGNVWHHIVEQCQVDKSNIPVELIQNPQNLRAIDKATHDKISGYYNSIDSKYSDTMRVRNWLAGHSFQYQYNFGVDVLNRFGY